MSANTFLPPKHMWGTLPVSELLSIKSTLQEIYYNAASAKATYANSYKQFIAEVDALISQKEQQQQ